MKKAIFTLICAILTFTAFAQDFIPILQEDNKWSVDTFFCLFDPPTNPSWTVTEQVTIDAIPVEINGVMYSQILKDGEPSCLLREENGVVFKYNDEGERVLLDMNIQLGEEYSVVGSAYIFSPCAGVNPNNGIFFLEVMEIRTEFIAGTDRKVIVLTDKFFPGSEDMLWIEGIGTRAGLASSWQAWDVTCGSSLACFETNGINYFLNGADSCDNTTLSMDSFTKEDIVLHPNPVTSKSILQFPSDANIDLLKIYDVSGKLVKETKVATSHFIIDMMQYPSGLYFYQVFSENRLLKTAQFIVK